MQLCSYIKNNIYSRDFTLSFLLINYAYVKKCINMYIFMINYNCAKQDKKQGICQNLEIEN